MNTLFVCVTGVALSLGVASNAQAQVMGGGGYYSNARMGTGVYSGGVNNFWTGRGYRGSSDYSPSTDYSHFGARYNSWSGRYNSGGAFSNPYIGTFGYGRSSSNSSYYYNAWMARYGNRSRYR